MWILHNIAGFFWGLFDLLISPFRWVNDQFRESPRTRAFLYAIPSLFAAFTGVALVTAAQISRESEMIEQYDELADAAHNMYIVQVEKWNAARRLMQSTPATVETANSADTTDSSEKAGSKFIIGGVDVEQLPDDQQTIVHEIKRLKEDEQCYLQKLISLDPVNETFRYRYAMSFELFDPIRQLELMQKLAPADGSGYADAHLWMATYFYSMPSESGPQNESAKREALKHAEHCLVLDKTRRNAEVIKANSLVVLNRLPEALESFRTLFETEPEFFQAIVAINKRIGRDKDNQNIYELAAQKLEAKVRQTRDLDATAWGTAVRHFWVCMVESANYTRLFDFLTVEETLAAGNEIRLEFLKHQRGSGYAAWGRALTSGRGAPATLMPQAMEKLKLALELIPNDEVAKQMLAWIAVMHPEFREDVTKIYNPFNDSNAPGAVLQILGNNEMQQQNYSKAIGYYEDARRKSPADPDLLNNLAYAYLLSDVNQASRALWYVNQAIRMRPPSPANVDSLSRYYHTRGAALLQMGRFRDAAADFEMALQKRPNDEGILESLVKCYADKDPQQAAVYQRRLDSVRAGKTPSNSSSTSNTDNNGK